MVNYQLNSNIKNAMNIMFKECEIPEDRMAELKSYIPKEENQDEIYTISHRIIKEVSDNLLKKYPGEEGNKYRFNNLIKSSKMVLESPKPRVKSPELLKILEDIKREQENKEYLKLTNMDDDEDNEGFGAYASIANKQITLIFNLLLSIAAGFTAGYVLASQLTNDAGKKTLLGFLVAGVIGFAEGWFMMKDFLLLEKNEDGIKNNSDIQYEYELDQDGLPVIPQIKDNKTPPKIKESKKDI